MQVLNVNTVSGMNGMSGTYIVRIGYHVRCAGKQCLAMRGVGAGTLVLRELCSDVADCCSDSTS